MLAGFGITARIEELDYDNAVVLKLKERHAEKESHENLDTILSSLDKDMLSMLDIGELFETKDNGCVYYVVKNLGDGNYISVK